MTQKKKRQITIAVIVMLVLLLVGQLQPFIVRARGGVDGSFGFRPMTSDCIGILAYGDEISYLPFTAFRFQLLYFKFDYSFSEDDFDQATPMCLGQDVWVGE